jgi:tripartite-type tricarboxylate transporter receptor subunit TctC
MKIACTMAAAVLALAACNTLAQSYPAKHVKLVVPFPAGSATDLVARLVSRELQDAFGQPFVVENKPGAQGAIAAEMVAKSPADGYTLLVPTNTQAAANVSLFKKLPYDPVKDFAPVARIASTSLVLMVKTDFPAKTLPEFIAHLKKNPGRFSAGYGSSSSQVCISQLERMAQVDVADIPYRGIPLAVNDLLAGTIHFTFVDLGNAMSQLKGGKLHAIAITDSKRSPLVSDLPTMAEALPGYEVTAWFALLSPTGTPSDVVQKLQDAAIKALAKPDVQEKLAAIGMQPAPMSAAELAPFIKTEIAKWARLIKEAGIEPE